MINEQAPECCPFCGSAITVLSDGRQCRAEDDAWVAFTCLTSWHRGHPTPRNLQSRPCESSERERLTRELDEARARVASAIADRDTARARAEQVWKLREEFVALLGTDDIQKGVETVSGLLARVKRLEEALEACAAIIGPRDKVTWATDEQVDHAWELYTKAKEAKP